MSEPLARIHVQLFAPGKSNSHEVLELAQAAEDLDLRTRVYEFVQGLLKANEATKSIKVAVTDG